MNWFYLFILALTMDCANGMGNFTYYGRQSHLAHCTESPETEQFFRNSRYQQFQLFEASSKYPSGILFGHDFHLGDYDLCLTSKYSPYSIRGKYCLVDIVISPKPQKYPKFHSESDVSNFSMKRDPYLSFLEKLKVTGDPREKPKNILHFGICIPRVCSRQDIEHGLSIAVGEIASFYGYNVTIKLPKNSCSTGEIKTYNGRGKFVWAVIITMLILVLLSTVCDLLRTDTPDQKDKFIILIESLSIRKNLSKLSKSNPTREFSAFNGMKTMSMMLIIMGHRLMTSSGGPLLDITFLEESYKSFPTILLLNGVLIVDTFFLIGGFLTFVALTEEYRKNKKLSTFKVCLHRWIRITPNYMLMVFFYAYVLENLGSGPVWSMKVGREAERCRKNWWTNFLYVNNYVNADRLGLSNYYIVFYYSLRNIIKLWRNRTRRTLMCMFQSWYVACDMHYMLISPAIVKLVNKMKNKGLFILTGCIVLSSFCVSLVTYSNKYDGIMRIYHSTFEDLANNVVFTQVYIKTHNRIIPYLSGMTAAYLYMQLKESNTDISRMKVWILSILATIFALSSICVAWIFYIPGREYNAVENALYASLHRVFWSLSMGWIAVASARNSFGIIQPILSRDMFIPLSKLSYGAYLVHGVVQIYMTSTLRTAEHMSYPKLLWITCGDVTLSLFFALLLHLLTEAPIRGITKLIL